MINLLDEETQKEFEKALQEIEDNQEEYWNSLSKEAQLKAFCAVIRRLHKSEIQDNGSYRHCLYEVFQFGPESYIQAQMAGFLDIHNAIYSEEELKELKNQ